jgi:SAM-dependent methyltransferase
MIGLAPGNILQLLYIRERVKQFPGSAKFLEIGAGNGMISTELLKMGFQGIAVDLNESACANNRKANEKFIFEKRYTVVNDDFMNVSEGSFDIIISCMVIEHIPEPALSAFIQKAVSLLSKNGVIIFLVPSGMKFWGIEDDIAGHIRRYERNDVYELANRNQLRVGHLAGLTYPVSNILFGLSNRIVRKNEAEKLQLSLQDRTVYTGNRDVPFKTTFPFIFSIILNPIALWPFHMLQKWFSGSTNSMVLYFELSKEEHD